jgi:hypothetical protein
MSQKRVDDSAFVSTADHNHIVGDRGDVYVLYHGVPYHALVLVGGSL